MKQTVKKTRHIAARTVWLSVISSIVVGLASLLVGLSIYGNTLMQDSISRARTTTSTAASSVRHGMDTLTWNILNQVDFPAQYANIPTWAASHHELLQGSGYPSGVSGESIPKEVRLLTILDIFDALTARDRPYKKPMSAEKALETLGAMADEGSIDPEILKLFTESEAWGTGG